MCTYRWDLLYGTSLPGGRSEARARWKAIVCDCGWYRRIDLGLDGGGSIPWSTISHVLFDFSGLGAWIYFRNAPVLYFAHAS